uniref:Uncharacterized protein n=1 Tax=Ditylenchus dipsaci TaxID=166011 RepID=A0A915EIM5_9BILA
MIFKPFFKAEHSAISPLHLIASDNKLRPQMGKLVLFKCPQVVINGFCIISFCNAVKWNCFGCFDKNDSFNYEHGNSVQQSAQPYPTHESLMYAAPAQSATWVNNHSTASFQPFHHGNPYTAPHQQISMFLTPNLQMQATVSQSMSHKRLPITHLFIPTNHRKSVLKKHQMYFQD